MEKVGRANRKGWYEYQSIAKPDADTLRKKNLPVCLAQRGREDPNKLNHHASNENRTEKARVCSTARKGADNEREEKLNTADPGYGRGCLIEGFGIVGLKEAEGV